MALTKPAGAWTYDDLFSLPDDGHRDGLRENSIGKGPRIHRG